MQARNNARIMITGSLDMFSDRYVIMWWFSSSSISIGSSVFLFVDEISSLCDSDFLDWVCRKLEAQ